MFNLSRAKGVGAQCHKAYPALAAALQGYKVDML